MGNVLRPALALVGAFTVLLGLAVPLAFTGVAQLLLPGAANGSLRVADRRVVGSDLIGQAFEGARYFHARPSATTQAGQPLPYNAEGSGGSNLAPSSAALLDAVKARLGGARDVPADAATASASGLDPDVSPENARGQAGRVAAARGLAPARVLALVEAQAAERDLGLFGERRVNVLRLNLALDAMR